MNDFGFRLEAELERYDATAKDAPVDPLLKLLFIVRAANAQDSAPAPTGAANCEPNAGRNPDGAGVDLESAKEYLRSGFATIGGVYLAPKSAGALLYHIESMERDAARFDWFFGATDKLPFMKQYVDGIAAGFTPDQWRAAIDTAIEAGGEK